MDRAIKRDYEEKRRMAEIFFEKAAAPKNPEHEEGADYWKDRMSNNLNVPWHRIGVKPFKEWEKNGFRNARRGDYEIFFAREKERMSVLYDGCKLRK